MPTKRYNIIRRSDLIGKYISTIKIGNEKASSKVFDIIENKHKNLQRMKIIEIKFDKDTIQLNLTDDDDADLIVTIENKKHKINVWNEKPKIKQKIKKLKTTKNKKQKEEELLEFIQKAINNRDKIGIQIMEEFNKVFGISNPIVSVCSEDCGSLKDHYDLVINRKDGTKMKCEVKSTESKIDVDKINNPWDIGVQRYNGKCKDFSCSIKYSKYWYQEVIKNMGIKEIFNIQSPLPLLEEWIEKDAYSCGDPKTDFGKELKMKFREKYSGSSMNGKNNSPKDYREEVNKKFVEDFNENDKKTLIKEVQEILDTIMKEKECWLNICGNLKDGFDFKWFEKIPPPQIKDVKIHTNPGADIKFDFVTDNNNTNFSSILRFGKGTGFSNIRFDIR